jgi:hypothetical protein
MSIKLKRQIEEYQDTGDEYEVDTDFESKYDKMFGAQDSEDGEFEHDAVTGRKNKRPKMSLLNKSRVTKQEMDELFLEH